MKKKDLIEMLNAAAWDYRGGLGLFLGYHSKDINKGVRLRYSPDGDWEVVTYHVGAPISEYEVVGVFPIKRALKEANKLVMR